MQLTLFLIYSSLSRALFPHEFKERSQGIRHHFALDKHRQVFPFACGEIHHRIAIDVDVARELVLLRDKPAPAEFLGIVDDELDRFVGAADEDARMDSLLHAHLDEEIVVVLADDRRLEEFVRGKNQQLLDAIFVQTSVERLNHLLRTLEDLDLRNDRVLAVKGGEERERVAHLRHVLLRRRHRLLQMRGQGGRRLAEVILRVALVELRDDAAGAELVEDAARRGAGDVRAARDL